MRLHAEAREIAQADAGAVLGAPGGARVNAFTPAEHRILKAAIDLYEKGDENRKDGIVVLSLNPKRFTLRDAITPDAVDKMKARIPDAAKSLAARGFILIMLDASRIQTTGKVDFRAHITPAGYLAVFESEAKE